MNRFVLILLLMIVMFNSCSETSTDTTEKTEFELLQYKWRVATMDVDGTAFPTNAGNVDKIRITFSGTNYTYVYPAPPDSPAEILGTMLTLQGTWRFNDAKTKIYLDRTAINEVEFEWEILQLSRAIFKARYVAQNPFDATKLANYDFGYTVDL